MTYPTEPGHVRHSETSKAAADSIKPDAARIRKRVLDFIAKVSQPSNLGPIGATCDEAEYALSLSHQTASARISELRQRGQIVAIGKRQTRSGKQANIYIVAETQEQSA